MDRLCWWLVGIAARLLDSDERDAVLGDFAESGETAGQSLRGILGLLVRRQAILFNDWRAWLTLGGLIVPLGMLLSIISRVTSDQNATYIWMYANNWDSALFKYTGFWYELADSILFVSVTCLTLVCWSWTAGFVVGSVSRRITRGYGVLFCVVLVFGALVVAPGYLAYWVHNIGMVSHPDALAFTVFYTKIFPLIVQSILVAVPSLLGMRQGADAGRFSLGLRLILWSLAIGTLAELLIQEPGFGLLANSVWRPWIGQVRLLSFIVYWPLAYFIANAAWRRRFQLAG